MRLGGLLLLLLLVLLAGFVSLNWTTFLASTPLSLGLVKVEAPLGLIMLAVTIMLTGPSWAYAFYVRRSALLRAGRTSEEMHALRELAERAEASRYTELREFLTAELQKLSDQQYQLRAEILADLEKSCRPEQESPPL